LGEYFRFLTRNSSDSIPLIDEINHAKGYLDIQATRFSKRLHTSFMECPAKFHSIKVPRLILQPILENAFVHGIERKAVNGFVSVAFEENGDMLHIIVEDNGNEISDSEIQNLQLTIANAGGEQEITGIHNIHKRLQLSFSEGSGLQVMRSGLGGLKAVIKINTCGSVTHD
jgi:two-component system sensor histidine kinase YesM